MDPKMTDFIKVKEIINKIEVKRGTILVEAETLNEIYGSFPEILEKPQVEYYLTPDEVDEGLTRIDAIEFFGGDGDKLDISDLLLNVRREMDENLSLPFDPEIKIAGIKEIINFYSDVEKRIVKNEDGKYQYDDIHPVDLTIENFNSFERTIYLDTLEIIMDKLIKEIYHLDKTIFILENENSDKSLKANERIIEDNLSVTKKRESRQYPTKSFQLNPDLFTSDSIVSERLKDFHKAFIDSNLISPIDLRFFIHAFKNRSITKKIKWTGEPKELYYLIKTLHEKNLIVGFKNYWDVTCKCFEAYNRKNILCTSHYLQRCKKPTLGEQLRKLNSVIATLE
jgi:hypothetical protein